MGEWAQMRSRKASSSHGWSAYGGQALGAYYPQQDPSGSSSGSAVAPSVGMALGALGTETSGSIVLPAEKGNIVGIKPTLGLTSRYVNAQEIVSQSVPWYGPQNKYWEQLLVNIFSNLDKPMGDYWLLPF